MTPVEVIRRAAKEMREKAEACVPGRWTVEDGVQSWDLYVGRGEGAHGYKLIKAPKKSREYAEYWPYPAESAHIAAFDPTVALAVAEWLEKAATTYEIEIKEGMGTSIRRITPALAVARAFLREESW